jgi:hypothetical protein
MENTIICPSMSLLGWGLRSVDSCSVLLISLTGSQLTASSGVQKSLRSRCESCRRRCPGLNSSLNWDI